MIGRCRTQGYQQYRKLFQLSKTSIITPVYNGEAFINRHYESVVSTVKSEFEIIYIDNNSADCSVQFIEALMACDNRVRLFHCKIQGTSAARNVGLSNSKGSVLCFLDVDDLFYDDVVNRQISLADSGIPSQCFVEIDKAGETAPIWKSETDYNFYLNFGNQAPFSSFVTPFSQIRFNEAMQTSEDWLYIVENRKYFGRIFLVHSVGRKYNSTTGFSSRISEDELLLTHARAIAYFYSIHLEDAFHFLSRLYYNKTYKRLGFLETVKLVQQFFGLRNYKSIYRLMRLFLV